MWDARSRWDAGIKRTMLTGRARQGQDELSFKVTIGMKERIKNPKTKQRINKMFYDSTLHFVHKYFFTIYTILYIYI